MPPRQPVPRIRVDLLDNSPSRWSLSSLSPSSTFDIKDIMGPARLLPKLLTEDFVFDNADDALCFEDDCSQDFFSFPVGRQPPLFILISHRARLLFSSYQDAFDPDDFFRDEDARPLLTAPTVPRMKRMIREQLYVQKWVDALTPNNPPRHIPWTCEKPAMNKKWIAEGAVFPADMAESSIEQRGAVQGHSFARDRNGFSTDKVPPPQELYTLSLSESSGPIYAFTESHTSTIRPKSADVDPDIFRGQSKTSCIARRVVKTPQTLSPPTLLPYGSAIAPSTPDVPLAARRGKSLSSLKLKRCVIEQLDYPDIPTAFRGSPVVWSPRFDTFPIPSLTDHESMLLDLKSKCAALRNGASTCIQGLQRPRTAPTRTLFSADEWAFTQGYATLDNNSLGSIQSQALKEVVANTSMFPLGDSPTSTKGPSFAAPLGSVPRLHSTPVQSPAHRSNDPPGLPLPPRPALINPSTPPHVRGILKKAKSVRFEDMTTKDSENGTSSVVPLQASLEHPSPVSWTISSERPCTPKPNSTKPSSGQTPVKEALGRNIQGRSAPGSRLPPRRARAKEKLEPTPLNLSNLPASSKSTPAITPVELPCRIHSKENIGPDAIPRAQAKQKVLPVTEVDVRRGIEGTTKSRLSTPLRNIFRFR